MKEEYLNNIVKPDQPSLDQINSNIWEPTMKLGYKLKNNPHSYKDKKVLVQQWRNLNGEIEWREIEVIGN